MSQRPTGERRENRSLVDVHESIVERSSLGSPQGPALIGGQVSKCAAKAWENREKALPGQIAERVPEGIQRAGIGQ